MKMLFPNNKLTYFGYFKQFYFFSLCDVKKVTAVWVDEELPILVCFSNFKK